jgi:Flp pilus assembly protein TadD
LLGAAFLFPLQYAGATVDEEAALAAYVRARAAGALGAAEQATKNYAAALALSPANEILAERALREALGAGDRSLALSAAHILDKAGKLGPDGRLLLFAEALEAHNWRAAGAEADKLEQDEVFAFMAPLLRAWIAQGSRKGNPLDLIEGLSDNPLGEVYAVEHRPLLLLASGRHAQGLAALQPLLAQGGAREARLRVAAASLLARKGKRGEALDLLQGDSAPLAVARRRLESGKSLAAAIDSPAKGVAELLVRIAVDLASQQVSQLALGFARLSTFLAPEDSETWMVTAELLRAAGQRRAALAALTRVPADDPFAGQATDTRISILVENGQPEEALAQAKATVAADPDALSAWTRLGDLYSELGRHEEAADAYGKALALVKAGAAGQPEWALWLLRGGALSQADKWPEAKAALLTAYKLAPDQAVVLNYLGYSQLERRENVAEAERLIREASRLQPNDAAITDSLGWAHYLRGDLAKAIELLEQAAQGQPADAAIKEHLGDAYYRAGRRYEARYAWQAALVHAEGKAMQRLRTKIDTGLRPDLAAP